MKTGVHLDDETSSEGDLIDSVTVDLTEEAVDGEVIYLDDDKDEAPQEWENNADEVKRFLDELGLFAGKSVASAEDISQAAEKSDIRKMTYAMQLVSKAARMQAKGLDIIASVVGRRPTLEPLSRILLPYRDFSVQEHAIQSVKTEQNIVSAAIHPKRTSDNKYKCSLCGDVWGSWSGCQSHIMRSHTHLEYGPCEKCHKFVTTNSDSYNVHTANCGKKDGKGKSKGRGKGGKLGIC